MSDAVRLHFVVDGDNFTMAGQASVAVKKNLRQLGISPETIRKVSIAMYEGEINMVIHAGGGEADVFVYEDMVEIVLKKLSPSLYQALGVFLPLITTNCCILGVAILVAQGTYNTQGLEANLLTGVVYAIATAFGFALAMIIFAGIREHLSMMNIPRGMQGMAIALVTAGLLAMAFMGFSGVDAGLAKALGL